MQLTGIVQGSHAGAGSGTWLLAVRSPHGGIYRLRRTAEEVTSTRLAEGSALRLCDHGSGVVWAALAREGRVALVRLSTADDTVISRTVAAAVAEAMRAAEDDEISADVLLSVLDVADKAMWPDADAILWAAAQHRSPVVRREAASWVSRAVARATVDVALLWLLAHDDDVQVRRSAFAAAKELCGSGARGTVCAELLGYFMADAERQIGWGARDLLLTFDPERALQGAPTAYKLDALAALGVRLETDASASARRALDLLVQDLDPGVRRTAVLIMNRLEP